LLPVRVRLSQGLLDESVENRLDFVRAARRCGQQLIDGRIRLTKSVGLARSWGLR